MTGLIGKMTGKSTCELELKASYYNYCPSFLCFPFILFFFLFLLVGLEYYTLKSLEYFSFSSVTLLLISLTFVWREIGEFSCQNQSRTLNAVI